MGGLSSEKVNGISHPEELEDGEVEEGQIDDDLLPDVGAKDETAIPEVVDDQNTFSLSG